MPQSNATGRRDSCCTCTPYGTPRTGTLIASRRERPALGPLTGHERTTASSTQPILIEIGPQLRKSPATYVQSLSIIGSSPSEGGAEKYGFQKNLIFSRSIFNDLEGLFRPIPHVSN